MKKRNIKPYADDSMLVLNTGLSRRYIGDIALAKRRCPVRTLERIEEALNKPGLSVAMLRYWIKEGTPD